MIAGHYAGGNSAPRKLVTRNLNTSGEPRQCGAPRLRDNERKRECGKMCPRGVLIIFNFSIFFRLALLIACLVVLTNNS